MPCDQCDHCKTELQDGGKVAKLGGAKSKPKSSRKPSAYNIHIKNEMKGGKSMKEAAASWKKQK